MYIINTKLQIPSSDIITINNKKYEIYPYVVDKLLNKKFTIKNNTYINPEPLNYDKSVIDFIRQHQLKYPKKKSVNNILTYNICYKNMIWDNKIDKIKSKVISNKCKTKQCHIAIVNNILDLLTRHSVNIIALQEASKFIEIVYLLKQNNQFNNNYPYIYYSQGQYEDILTFLDKKPKAYKFGDTDKGRPYQAFDLGNYVFINLHAQHHTRFSKIYNKIKSNSVGKQMLSYNYINTINNNDEKNINEIKDLIYRYRKYFNNINNNKEKNIKVKEKEINFEKRIILVGDFNETFTRTLNPIEYNSKKFYWYNSKKLTSIYRNIRDTIVDTREMPIQLEIKENTDYSYPSDHYPCIYQIKL